MGPENYGFLPFHFLPFFWPHYSLFRSDKCFHFRICKRLSSFLLRFPSQFYIYNGLGQFKMKFVKLDVPI